MARLSAEQWAMARADYEIRGLSVTEIARQYGCAKSAVSMRAKADGWQAGKTEQAVADKSNAIMQLARVEQETEQKLNATERAVFDAVVRDDVAFRLQNDADMEAVREHAMRLLPMVEKPADAKALMETLRIQREARLGKSPDTAIQINNNAPVELEPRAASQKIAGLLAVAQARRDAAK
mgnify:CR=1 FL=1